MAVGEGVYTAIEKVVPGRILDLFYSVLERVKNKAISYEHGANAHGHLGECDVEAGKIKIWPLEVLLSSTCRFSDGLFDKSLLEMALRKGVISASDSRYDAIEKIRGYIAPEIFLHKMTAVALHELVHRDGEVVHPDLKIKGYFVCATSKLNDVVDKLLRVSFKTGIWEMDDPYNYL